MHKKILTFCLLLVIHQTLWASDRPVVLSIPFITDQSKDWSKYPKSPISVRILTQLLNKYDCIICNRSGGYNIAIEEKIRSIAGITNPTYNTTSIVAPDHIITGAIWDGQQAASLKGHLDFHDMDADKAITYSATVAGSSSEELLNNIVEKIAKKLKLSEKKSIPAQQSMKSNLTWIILPVERLDIRRKKTASKKLEPRNDPNAIALSMELALQKNNPKLQLVDHKTIDKVIRELTIANIARQDDLSPTMLGRITGANRIIAGTVSRAKKGLWLDMRLLDGETSIILNSQSKLCTKDTINDSAAKLTRILANSNIQLPELKTATPAEKQREAEIYHNLETSFNPIYRPYLILETAEAAYLLQHNNPSFSYSIGRKLAKFVKVISEVHLGLIHYDAHSLSRAGNMAERILSTMRHGPDTQAPLLLRAEILFNLNKHKESISLINEHLSKQPDCDKTRALLLKAKCMGESGETQAAVTILNDIDHLSGVSDKTRTLRLKYDTSLNTKEQYRVLKAKYGLQQKIKRAEKGCSSYNRDVPTYLELTRIFEGPSKALREIDKIDFTLPFGFTDSIESSIHMEKAKSLQEIGDKASAGRVCKDLLFRVSVYPGHWKRKALGPNEKAAKTMLKNIKNDIGTLPPFWKNAAEVKSIPSNYVIYLVPIDTFDKEQLIPLAKTMTDYFGSEVKIQKYVTLPEECQVKGTHKYNAPKIWDYLLKNHQFPENALHITFITDHWLGGTTHNICLSSVNEGNPLLIRKKLKDKSKRNRKTFLSKNQEKARQIISSFRYSHVELKKKQGFPWHNKRKCKQFTCAFSEPANYGGQGLRLSICPECQKEYKNADFDKMHNELMKYLKKMGAKIVDPSEVEFTVVEPGKDKQKAKK